MGEDVYTYLVMCNIIEYKSMYQLTNIAGIVHTYMQTTSILRARILYERVVTNFPTSGRYWRLYVEQEVKCAWNVRLTLSLHETFIVPKLLAHFNVVRMPCSSVLVRCVLIRKGYLLAKSKCKVQFEWSQNLCMLKDVCMSLVCMI